MRHRAKGIKHLRKLTSQKQIKHEEQDSKDQGDLSFRDISDEQSVLLQEI